MKIIQILFCVACSVTSVLAADYYTEPPLYGMRPHPNFEIVLGPIGVTGIEARIGKGVEVIVENVLPNTPAFGKCNKGDVILGINGVKLEGKNPLVILGTALNKAEATDGKMAFDIKSAQNGELKGITCTIPVLGAYSKTFPLNCEKSKGIVKRAAEFYASKDRMKGHNWLSGLACLFLLSTGDDHYVPRVKEYFAQFLKPDGGVTGIRDMTWDNGYNGVACAEYFLRTGDRSVLPILQHYCDDAKKRQAYNAGWGHWGIGYPSYESGGGMMHSAGNQVLLTLVLSKACGVNVDEKALRGALTHWYRFAGHGTIPAADQRPWHIFRSGGRDGATAAVMHVASGAKGNTAIYKQAKEYFAMTALTSWPSRTYNWEVIWGSLAGHFVRDFNPELFQETQQMFFWSYDLHRQTSGAFYFKPDHPSLNGTDEGISLALAFTAPLKTLHITGAPRSKHAKDFTLPEHLWGTEADLAFLSVKNHKDFYKYGKDDPSQVPFLQLPVDLRYGPQMVKNLPPDMMLKNVRHARYEVRTAAAKALMMNKRYGDIEDLLRDADPRLRRAGLDGINDYLAWFNNKAVGGQAMKAGEFTPVMCEEITRVLSDPKEAWYVIDAALLALHHAPHDLIRKNIPLILPWTTHTDWFLRESAFLALMGLQEDEALFTKSLPTLIDIMVKENHYNPHLQMTLQLKKALARWKAESAVGKLIVAGFARATKETTVLADVGGLPFSRAGTLNISEAVMAVITQDPQTAATMAQALVSCDRLGIMETQVLINIVKKQDGYTVDRFLGLYPALALLPADQRTSLRDLLYDHFRPELLRRLEMEKDMRNDIQLKLFDLLVDLARLKQPDAGWHAVGEPTPDKRTWRFIAIDPVAAKDKMDPIVEKRWRDITLPSGMDNWFSPGFNDSVWKSGRTPIGVGVFKQHGKHAHGPWTVTPERSIPNHSEWGIGEFLLMRSTFEVKDMDYDYYRINILTDQGYHIYLNGKKLHSFNSAEPFPRYQHVMLGDKAKLLKKGPNTLAVYCNVRYEKDEKSTTYHPIGQIDLFIEGLKKKELGIAR